MARRRPFPAEWRLGGAGYEEIPCLIPGSIAEAVCRADIQDPAAPPKAPGQVLAVNPSCRIDEEAYGWVGRRPWLLRCSLPLAGPLASHLFLEIQGLCGSGAVYVDETVVARFEHSEDETLTVEITEHMNPEWEELPVAVRFSPPQHTGTSRLPGIRMGVWLREVEQVMVTRLCVRADWRQSALVATARVTSFAPGRYTFRYAVAFGAMPVGMLSFDEEVGADPAVFSHTLAIDGAHGWKLGTANELYTVKLTVLKLSAGCDVAFRRVAMADIDRARIWAKFPECVVGINGQGVRLRGVTWAAPAWYPYDSAWLRGQFAALERARINCLYVLEPQEERFYDLCDRRGMMVWQALREGDCTTMAVVRRLAHRACVVQWGLDAHTMDRSMPRDEAETEETIAASLLALGDDRPFVGLTPGGDTPYPAWKDLAQRQCFNVAGPMWYPGPEMLPRYGNDDDALIRVVRCTALQHPRALRDLYGNPLLWPRQGALWDDRGGSSTYLEQEEAARWFGRGVAGTLEQASLLGRYLQAEQLRYLAERARWRNAAGFFGGSAGQVADPFASDAIIDRDGTKRPAYYGLRSANAPIHVCVQLDRASYWVGARMEATIQLLVVPEHTDPERSLKINATVHTIDGKLLVEDIWEAPCRTAAVGRLHVVLPEQESVSLLRIEAYRKGVLMDRSDTLLCVGLHALSAALPLAPMTTLRLAEGKLTNVGEALALGVCCDGYRKEAMPGWGALLPGEAVGVREDAAVEALNAVLEVGSFVLPEGVEAEPDEPLILADEGQEAILYADDPSLTYDEDQPILTIPFEDDW